MEEVLALAREMEEVLAQEEVLAPELALVGLAQEVELTEPSQRNQLSQCIPGSGLKN